MNWEDNNDLVKLKVFSDVFINDALCDVNAYSVQNYALYSTCWAFDKADYLLSALKLKKFEF